MSSLYLESLGGLRLRGPAGDLLRGRRKELTLLVYLARRAPPPIPRDQLAELLWGDRPDARARHSLRQALVRLKQALGDVIVVETDHVTLTGGRLELDLASYESDLAQNRLREAVARWQGDFLAGADDLGGDTYRAWVEEERQGARNRLARALDSLASDAGRRGAWREAVGWTSRWAAAFPLDERAHRRWIEALSLAGQSDEALNRHAAFIARLRSDPGVEPSPEFLRLTKELERAARPRPTSRPSPGSTALFTPDLVGRDAALGELDAAWHGARAGQTTVVLVEGEEGIGRTRLCEEFLARVSRDPGRTLVLRARAHEAARDSQGTLARELLIGLRDAPGLAGAPPGALAALAELVPPVRERFTQLPASEGWTLANATVRVLADVAAEWPVVLFVDDIAGADRLSQELIQSLADGLRDAPILFLITVRSDDPPSSAIAALRARYGLRRVLLRPLDLAETERLLASMLEMAPPERRRLAERLHGESPANPYFLIQTVSALLDEGRVVPAGDGTWRLHVDSAVHPLPVSAGIRDAVRSRLEQLGPTARQVVEAAAVLAEPADLVSVAAVAGVAEAEAEAAVDELLARRLLRPLPGPKVGYEFVHDVTRRIVYQALPGERRRALHRRALAALRERPAEDAAARAAARYHVARAGSPRLRLTHWAWRRRRLLVAGTVLAAAAGIGFVTLMRNRPDLGPRDWVLLTDLANSTGDAIFDRSVNAAVTAALAQSRHVSVFPRSRVRETLQRMGRSDTTTVDEALAREIAVRENLQAVVALGLTGLDTVYLLTATVLDPAAGTTLASVTAQARGKADVLPALDGLVRRLRRALGEGRFAVARGVPLPDATTASLQALKDFAEGSRAWAEGDWRQAQALWNVAVALDSSFVAAQAALGDLYYYLDQRPTGEFHLQRAERLAHRLPERERLRTLARIAATRGDHRAAIDHYRAYLRQYPDDRDGWYNLGTTLKDEYQCREALTAFGEAFAIDPHMGNALINIAVCHDGLGEYREAADAFDRAFDLQPSNRTTIGGDLNRIYGFVQAKLGDTARAREVFSLLLSGDENQMANGERSLALLAMYVGRYDVAISHLREAVVLSHASNATLSEFRNQLYLAGAYRMKGQEAHRAAAVRAAAQIAAQRYLPPQWLAFLAQNQLQQGDLGAAAVVLDTILQRARAERAQDRAAGELVKGEIALAQARYQQAIDALELAYRLWPENLVLEPLGRAYARSGALERAAQVYQRLLGNKSLGWEAQEPWILAHYELGKVYQQLGDSARAAASFEQFTAMWARGDGDLPLLVDARDRLHALRGAAPAKRASRP